jgi:hypothetical protein
MVAAAVLGLTAFGAAQVGEIVKVLGIGALVSRFGGEINRAFNNLTGHRDTFEYSTKVVPILTGGVGSRNAVGAVQVMGPRRQVEQVQAVAQLEQDLFGRELRIRALIPISSREISSNIRRVEGVGVSGIIDLKL